MKTFRSLTWIAASFALVIIMIPQAMAGPLADAVKQTVNTSSFHYDANASIKLDKGGESDIPFMLELSAREEGGKSQSVYGKSGSLWAQLSNFEDLPSALTDMNSITMSAAYKGSFNEQTQVSLARLDDIKFASDNQTMGEIMGMVTEMSKLLSGRTFKMSQAAIVERLRDVMGDAFLPSDEELFLSALSGGNQSINEILSALGQFLDDMVASGFMKMEMSQQSSSRNRSRFGNNVVYTLRLGDQITEQGARVFRDGLANLLSAALPGFGEAAARDIAQESTSVIAEDLNNFLSEAKNAEFSIELAVSPSGVQGIDFLMDLTGVGLPLQVSETVTFSYVSGFTAAIPQDEANTIDVNEIINGFIAIGEMTQSAFESNFGGYNDFQEVPLPYSESGSLVEEDITYIRDICGFDTTCIRREVLTVKRTLLSWLQDGYITQQEYDRASRELNTLLR